MRCCKQLTARHNMSVRIWDGVRWGVGEIRGAGAGLGPNQGAWSGHGSPVAPEHIYVMDGGLMGYGHRSHGPKL